MKYRTVKNVKELDRLIELCVEAAGTMRDRVQNCAFNILQHAEKHGDYTRAQILVDGLGEGVNGKALVEYFVRFGGLIVDTEEGGFNGWHTAQFIRDNVEAAKATMWYTLKPINAWQGYSAELALVKFVKENQTAKKAMAKLADDDPKRAKYKMDVSDATIQQVINICDFQIVTADEDEALIEALEQSA